MPPMMPPMVPADIEDELALAVDPPAADDGIAETAAAATAATGLELADDRAPGELATLETARDVTANEDEATAALLLLLPLVEGITMLLKPLKPAGMEEGAATTPAGTAAEVVEEGITARDALADMAAWTVELRTKR